VQQASFDGKSGSQLYEGQTALTAQAKFDLAGGSGGAATVRVTGPAAGGEMYSVQVVGRPFPVAAGVTYFVVVELKASKFAAPFALGLIWDKVRLPGTWMNNELTRRGTYFMLCAAPYKLCMQSIHDRCVRVRRGSVSYPLVRIGECQLH
jgi:hypothetical protein